MKAIFSFVKKLHPAQICYALATVLPNLLVTQTYSLLTTTTVAGVERLAASVSDSLCVCVSVCVSVCLSVCPHDKTKTAETRITKLGTGIVPPINIGSKGQRSRSQGHKVQKGDRVAGMSYALYRLPSL